MFIPRCPKISQISRETARNGSTIRVSARLTYAKRTATFTLSGDSDTRYWRRDSDYGWNGTLTGVRLSLTTETSE